MGRRRRLGWLLVPVVGAAAMFALPPMDEYAPLDRIGTRFDPPEVGVMPIPPDAPPAFRADLVRMNQQARELARRADEASGVGRHRSWRVRVPEAEARRVFARLFSKRTGWQSVGRGSDSTSSGDLRTTSVSTIYANDATGDQAAVETTTQVVPPSPAKEIVVSVGESKASMGPWARVKRWASRLFAR